MPRGYTTRRQLEKKLGYKLPHFPTKIEQLKGMIGIIENKLPEAQNFIVLETYRFVFLEDALQRLAPSVYTDYKNMMIRLDAKLRAKKEKRENATENASSSDAEKAGA